RAVVVFELSGTRIYFRDGRNEPASRGDGRGVPFEAEPVRRLPAVRGPRRLRHCLEGAGNALPNAFLRHLRVEAGGGEHVDAVLDRKGWEILPNHVLRLAAGGGVAGEEGHGHAVMAAEQRIQPCFPDRPTPYKHTHVL